MFNCKFARVATQAGRIRVTKTWRLEYVMSNDGTPAKMETAMSGTTSDIDGMWQSVRLETQLLKADGTAFELLFQQLASARWPGTFAATLPMGRRGDLKCDGYESIAGAVHQCWGPRNEQIVLSTSMKKVTDDFRGAKQHWGEQMKIWRFVHNTQHNALPSEIVRLLAELSGELACPYETWGTQHILVLAKEISADLRAQLLGVAPRSQNFAQRVTFDGIGRVLAYIQQSQTTNVLDPIEPSVTFEKKITHNLLSNPAAHFLRLGQSAEYRVGDYLSRKVKPQEADDIVQAFKNRYLVVRSEGRKPNEILTQLQIFAGGVTGDHETDFSALAVVAHLFLKCEVFERPPVTEIVS